MIKKHLSKRAFVIVVCGLVVLAGCLVALASSIRHLPPETIRPSTKPALNIPSNDQTAMKVQSQPVETASVSVVKPVDSSVKTAANCGQTQSSQPQQANTDDLQRTVSVASLSLPKDKDDFNLGAKLQKTLLDVTGSLSQ